MIQLICNLSLSIFFPIIFGYSLLCAIFPKNSFSTSLLCSLSFGLGLGIIGQWMLWLDILGISLITVNIILPLSVVSFVMALKTHKTKYSKIKILIPTSKKTFSKQSIQYALISLSLMCIILISLDIIQAFWLAMNIPIKGWDAVATIAYKAKIFYYQQEIPPLRTLPHLDYPLFTSLMESWVAMNLGYWHDQYVKIIFPSLLLSFIIIVYYFLRLHMRRTWALLGIVFILSANFLVYHATVSYTDLSLMYYNCLTIIFLIIYASTQMSGFLICSGIYAGFATFVKLEGTAFLAIYTFLLFLIIFKNNKNTLKAKLKYCFNFLLPSYGMCITFFIVKYFNQALKEDSVHMDKTNLDFSISKIPFIIDIVKSFLNNLLLSGNWGIIWFIFFLTLFNIKLHKRTKEIKLLILSIFLFFGLYGAVALFTSNYTWIAGENRLTGLSRLFLHFYPLAPISLALMFFQSSQKITDGQLKPS